MKQVLSEIQDGTFARDWLLENQAGCPHFLAQRRIEARQPAGGGGQGPAQPR